MTDGTRTVQVRIEGRVQGVGYRMWTQRTARALGLAGWVRNRHDGAVEAVFQGGAESVEAMLARCQEGPPGARVTGVGVVGEGVGCFVGFEVRETA